MCCGWAGLWLAGRRHQAVSRPGITISGTHRNSDGWQTLNSVLVNWQNSFTGLEKPRNQWNFSFLILLVSSHSQSTPHSMADFSAKFTTRTIVISYQVSNKGNKGFVDRLRQVYCVGFFRNGFLRKALILMLHHRITRQRCCSWSNHSSSVSALFVGGEKTDYSELHWLLVSDAPNGLINTCREYPPQLFRETKIFIFILFSTWMLALLAGMWRDIVEWKYKMHIISSLYKHPSYLIEQLWMNEWINLSFDVTWRFFQNIYL